MSARATPSKLWIWADNASVAALGIAASASGMGRTRTTALMTVEEVDQALAKSINYRPPGH
jgi:hypothetical protein